MDAPRMAFLNPEGNGVRILSLDGGDNRCVSQLLILQELMHRLEYDYGRSVRPCEFFHSITSVGAAGVIAILLGVLCMTVEEALTAFIGICEKVSAPDIYNSTRRSEILKMELEKILDGLHLPSNSLLLDAARVSGCCVSICHSNAATHGCRIFRNYKSTQYSYNPTIIEAARSSWATPGLFSSIYVGPPMFAEELISAVNGFNNPTLQALQEARDFYGVDKKVSTFLSLGSGKRGPISIYSNDSLRRIAQRTDVTEEDVEREIGASGVYYRLSPKQTIDSDTFGMDSNQFGTIILCTRAYLNSMKTTRTIESYLNASSYTSIIDLKFSAEAQRVATHIVHVPKTPRFSLEERYLLQKNLRIQGLECGSSLQGCMKGTREGILQRINDWTTDFTAPNILWLKGDPGVGKSAIATELVEQLAAVGRLGSSFFFQRQRDTLLTPHALWRTAAYDLARRHPTIRRTIIATLEGNEVAPATINLEKLFRHFIQDPLLKAGKITSGRLPVIVVDALDERGGGLEEPNSELQERILDTLRSWSSLPPRFKLIISSREENDLNLLFSTTKHCLVEISAGQTNDPQSSEDIRVFLTAKLQEITPRYPSLPRSWPDAESIKKLVEMAAGFFIRAQTAVEFIQSGEPQRRLDYILKDGVSGGINDLCV